MPITRRIIQVGRSFAITLPKSWVIDAQNKSGKKMVEVAMEVNGTITITPKFGEENNVA